MNSREVISAFTLIRIIFSDSMAFSAYPTPVLATYGEYFMGKRRVT
jgi:hypothetical protein